jgi:uncharacterized FlaG/YvyC family protein
MSEEPISSIKRVESQPNQTAQVYQAYQNNLNQSRLKASVADNNSKKPDTPKDLQNVESDNKILSKLAPGLGRITALRFQVNSRTNELIVQVVDRESQKVISTIPTDAIKDIPVGELMQFSI